MKLKLKVNKTMTYTGGSNRIQLSSAVSKKLGTADNRYLEISGSSGKKHRLIVETHEEAGDFGRVNQKIFDLVSNIGAHTVTLGCDPEFVFVTSDGQVCPANLWLPHEGVIGSDGPLAELRPAPTTHEDALVDNLRHLVKALPKVTKERFGYDGLLFPEAHSECHNYALGFHIHLGAPRELITMVSPEASRFIRSLITVMDYFVGIPSLLLEDNNIRRLGDGIYGKAGDYRLKTNTIEYRTPGGFHLRHPDYSRGILGLALCVGKDVLTDVGDRSENWRYLERYAKYESYLQGKYSLPEKREVEEVLLDPTKRRAVSHVPNILNQLRRMFEYYKHVGSVKTYFNLVAKNTQFNPRLLANW